MDQGGIALVLDVAKRFWACQSPSCVGVGDALQFFQENTASGMQFLRAPAEGTV